MAARNFGRVIAAFGAGRKYKAGEAAYRARRDAMLRAVSTVVEPLDPFAGMHTNEALLAPKPPVLRESVLFSPAETQSLIASALHLLRERPLRPQCRSAYGNGPAFVEARRRAKVNGARLLAVGEDVTPPDEPHDGCVGVLESLLGAIEQRFEDVGLPLADGRYDGFHQRRPKDMAMPRRSKVNKRDDLNARSKLRVAVHNDGNDAFAARIPDDIIDRVTRRDGEGDAHRLLDAICDERPALRWLRDEGLGLSRRPRARVTRTYSIEGDAGRIKWEPVGRSLGWDSEQVSNAYFNTVAGRLVAEGYEPSTPRIRSKLSPGIAASIADRAPPTAVGPPPPREVIPGHDEAYFDRLLDELLLAGWRVVIDSESAMHTNEALLAPKPPIERGAVSAVVNLRGIEIGLLRTERKLVHEPTATQKALKAAGWVSEKSFKKQWRPAFGEAPEPFSADNADTPGRKLDQKEVMAIAAGRGMIPHFLCGIYIPRALTANAPPRCITSNQERSQS
jgi:hypothetical protein